MKSSEGRAFNIAEWWKNWDSSLFKTLQPARNGSRHCPVGGWPVRKFKA